MGVIRPPVTQSARSRRSILRKKEKKQGNGQEYPTNPLLKISAPQARNLPEWEQYSRVERRYNKGPRDWQNVLAITRLRYSERVLSIVWRPLNAQSALPDLAQSKEK